ncbi:MAG: DNA-binding response regulator [Flammeovirgaceae bacterium]|nr:DNA-binding response regulator [Flammeovirgaceae bacterium]HCX21046.1 DNA-binding response regulator [Cytophagales bacterium]
MMEILLVDDHKMVRDAFSFYFDDSTDYRIKKQAVNGDDALKHLKADTFDLLITDINMPVMNGLELVQAIRDEGMEIKILVVSMLDDIKSIKKMLNMGIEGYILKDSGKDVVMTAIQAIEAGNNFFAQEVTQRVMESMGGNGITPKNRLTIEIELSTREKEVLKLVLDEKTNQEIADQLFISVRTVEGHKRSMLTKTGCKNLVGLTMYAIEHNLVEIG